MGARGRGRSLSFFIVIFGSFFFISSGSVLLRHDGVPGLQPNPGLFVQACKLVILVEPSLRALQVGGCLCLGVGSLYQLLAQALVEERNPKQDQTKYDE
jgi:hypothetical protein